MRVRFAGLIVALLGLATMGHAAQPAATAAPVEPPDVCPYTYQQYLNIVRGSGRFAIPWSHSWPAEQERAYRTQLWAGREWLARTHHNDGLLISLDRSCSAHAARWLAEAAAYGDVIVPIRGEPTRPYLFFVAHAGTPPNIVEAMLAFDLPRYGLAYLTDGAIRAYREETPAEIAAGVAIAIAEAAVPPPPYEVWRGALIDMTPPVLWDHAAPLLERAEATAATTFTQVDLSLPTYGSGVIVFLDVPADGTATVEDRYWARWLMEAMAGGDTVVPYLGLPEVTHRRAVTDGRISEPVRDGARPLRFAIFAAGLSPHIAEAELRDTLMRWERLPPDEVEAVVETWRALTVGGLLQ
ncbi:MAG: hypothetical protein IT534_13280 [Bauldia sp.]|nr:hypothetical protein [Bauldia sp.]